MKLIFVQPNASKKIYQDLSKSHSAIEPPIWTALIAKHLILRNFEEFEILDFEALGLDEDQSVKKIFDFDPEIIVFCVYGQQPSASAQNMQGVSDLSKKIKEYSNDVKIISMGLYPSALPKKTLEDEKAIDFVIQGEGHYTLYNLLHSNLNDPKHLSKIQGLWYRDSDDNIIGNPRENIVSQENLPNELPGMAWEKLNLNLYRTSNWHALSNNNEVKPFASLYTSLGCPFHCTFCCINAPFGHNNVDNSEVSKQLRFRYWDPEFIIKEFEFLAENNIKNLKIADEMFVLNKQHFLKLCQLIIERKYNFNIWAYARIDTVKEEYLEILKKSGVNWLALGIEAGNQDVRKDVIKGKFTDVNIVDLVKKIQSYGINVIGNYIFGLPEDNHNTMKETLSLAKELNTEFANFYSAMAYPGSQLYLDAISNNIPLPESYSGYSQHSYDSNPLPTKYISSDEVIKFRDYAFNDYHGDQNYLNFIKSKFGESSKQEIINMLSVKLDRKFMHV